MLRKSKAISIVLAFVFCMTFLAPALISPAVAEASSTYEAIKTENVSNVGDYLTKPVVQIDVPNIAALSDGDILSVELPSDLKMADSVNAVVYGGSSTDASNASIFVESPAYIGSNANPFDNGGWEATFTNKNQLQIKVTDKSVLTGGTTEGRLYVNFVNVLVDGTFDNDITVNFSTPSTSGFSNGKVVVAKYISGGEGTITSVGSVTTMGSTAKDMDYIMIEETTKNSLETGDQIKLKLPKGFKWVSYSATGQWAWANINFPTSGDNKAFALEDEGRKLVITMPAGLGSLDSEGRLMLTSRIEVDDDSEAKLGEVVVHVSGDNVTAQDITIANYAEYGVEVNEGTVETVLAGWADTELGSFNIKENIKGSIIAGRTVTLTLPSDVEWDYDTDADEATYTNVSDLLNVKVIKGADWVKGSGSTLSVNKNKDQLKITLADNLDMGKTNIDLKEFKVRISPDFTGDLNITLSGSAGVEGEVKVAEVVAPVTMKVDKVANIVIGSQTQEIGDITITEGDSEAFIADAGAKTMQLRLPKGGMFAELPEVEVTEGDLEIDKVAYAENKQAINIIAKSASDKASTFVISGIKVTADRTVPEGDFKLSIDAEESTGLTDQAENFNVDTIAELVIGKCITPAPGDVVGNGQFRIDSNIYQVNGVSKVMDCTPYIKADRTYVPVRFLGYVLGLTENDIVWDGASQKVTMTKGDDVIELTIGSTTMYVNGEAVAMDVAPEITSDRTMLPARWVAEGFGYQVGWDAYTRTVIISK